MTERDLMCQVEGPEDSPLLVFVHGWPDDASLWRNQVAALRDRFRCLVVTLPNYGEAPTESGGADFPELAQRLKQTIDRYTDGPVDLVTHDWGAYIGYLFEQKYPERVRTMVAMDVGGHFEPDSFKTAAIFVSYQWALVTFWLIGGLIPPLGAWLSRVLARLIEVPPRQVERLRSRNNYPYFYYWRSTLIPSYRSRLLGSYQPQCRVLYLFGKRKPLMFHTPRWLEIVEAKGGKAVGIDGSHWFMESHAEETNQLLNDWFLSPSLH